MNTEEIVEPRYFNILVQLNNGNEHPKYYQFIPRLGDTLSINHKKYVVTMVTVLEKEQYNNYAASINADLSE